MMLTWVPIFILSAFQTSLSSYSRAPISQYIFSGDNQNVSERAKSVGNRQILRFGTPRIGRKGDL